MANDAASWVSNDQSGLDEIKVRVRSVTPYSSHSI